MYLFNPNKKNIGEISEEISPEELASLLVVERVFIYEFEFVFMTEVFTTIDGKDAIAGYISVSGEI